MVVKLTKLTKLTQKSLRCKNGYLREIKNPGRCQGVLRCEGAEVLRLGRAFEGYGVVYYSCRYMLCFTITLNAFKMFLIIFNYKCLFC